MAPRRRSVAAICLSTSAAWLLGSAVAPAASEAFVSAPAARGGHLRETKVARRFFNFEPPGPSPEELARQKAEAEAKKRSQLVRQLAPIGAFAAVLAGIVVTQKPLDPSKGAASPTAPGAAKSAGSRSYAGEPALPTPNKPKGKAAPYAIKEDKGSELRAKKEQEERDRAARKQAKTDDIEKRKREKKEAEEKAEKERIEREKKRKESGEDGFNLFPVVAAGGAYLYFQGGKKGGGAPKAETPKPAGEPVADAPQAEPAKIDAAPKEGKGVITKDEQGRARFRQ